MKRLAYIILSFLTIALFVAFPVFATTYSAIIQVTNSSGTSYNNGLPVILPSNNTYMASNNFTSTSMLDVQIQQGGSNIPFMEADNATYMFINPLGASSSYQLSLSTGNAPLSSFPIITGYGGYETTNDTAALEWGTSGNITARPYVDTSASMVGQDVYRKTGAVSVNVTAVGSLTATLWGTTGLSQTLDVDGAGDGTTIPILVGAATNWQAVLTNDGFASYVATVAGPFTDYYSVTNGTIPGFAVIDSVTVYSWWNHQTGVAAPATIALTARLGGADSTGGAHNWGGAGGYLLVSDALGRPGGGSWTPADISSLQIGITLSSGDGNDTSSTQVYVVVAYHIPNVSVTISSVSSGLHNVNTSLTLSGGVSEFKLWVDSTSANYTDATGNLTLQNTANNWVWGSNATPYWEYIKMNVAAPEVLWYQPTTYIVGSILPDRDGTKNGDITWGVNPSGVSAVMSSLSAGGTLSLSSPGGSVLPLAPESNSENATGGMNVPTTNPLYQLFHNIWGVMNIHTNNVTGEVESPFTNPATSISFPEIAIWFIIAVACITGGEVVSLVYLQNQFIAAVVGCAIAVGFWKLGVLPFGLFLVLAVASLSIIIWERKPSL
ncbi:MAG: hypothetical protein WC822_06135 [Candidatus Paceibacterota bacterium]|jgi:hypothetical protein